MPLIDYSNAGPTIGIDIWTHVADGILPPPDGPATISLERWKDSREDLVRRDQPLGLRLDSHERIEEILPDLSRFALIALDFPNLNDGRHFTTARLLRDRYRFHGRIRATGQVLRDQIDLMKRCGFDEFELPAGRNAASAISAFGEISIVYQPTADARPTAAQLRYRQPEQAMAS